jgi:hypothetical protein
MPSRKAVKSFDCPVRSRSTETSDRRASAGLADETVEISVPYWETDVWYFALGTTLFLGAVLRAATFAVVRALELG